MINIRRNSGKTMDSGGETEEDSAREECVSGEEGTVLSSNHREMRNKLEKQRRDRLNAFIAELAKLVPIISQSSKKMDKISILRLAATYLRIIQMLDIGKNNLETQFPKNIDQFVLEQLICEQLGGFLIIVTPNGKIVFVSHSVENLLGHLQIDLMGQSLYQITAPDDHDILRLYLQCETAMDADWRRYFKVKMKKAGPRSETIIFEEVRMTGVHILLNENTTVTSPMSSSSSSSTVSSSTCGPNYDIMLFFAQMIRPEPLSKQLLEATKDEYRTRHLIDGRIMDSDQRISFVAGYLIEEVAGQSAFNYMHRDDVRWVIIALRQMYDRKECYGDSCYRLQTGTGQFIYLKTKGYLEIDDQGTVESFVCINTMVSEKEGRYLINEMKKRFSALINNALTSESSSSDSPAVCLTPPPSNESVDLVEDPQKVQVAVSHLMTNLESTDQSLPSPSHATIFDNQVVEWASKTNVSSSDYHHQSIKIEPLSPKECSTITTTTTTSPNCCSKSKGHVDYKVSLKTALKRPTPAAESHAYGRANGNATKRVRTISSTSSTTSSTSSSSMLSPSIVDHQPIAINNNPPMTTRVKSPPSMTYSQNQPHRTMILTETKKVAQPEKSMYTHDRLLKQILQRK